MLHHYILSKQQYHRLMHEIIYLVGLFDFIDISCEYFALTAHNTCISQWWCNNSVLVEAILCWWKVTQAIPTLNNCSFKLLPAHCWSTFLYLFPSDHHYLLLKFNWAFACMSWFEKLLSNWVWQQSTKKHLFCKKLYGCSQTEWEPYFFN